MFMEPEFTSLETWYEIDLSGGTLYLPKADCNAPEIGDMTEHGRVTGITERLGFGTRLSAPGYLDSTEWSVFDSLQEAARFLLDTYYDAPDDELSAGELHDRAALEALATYPNP
ncbi:MAG: hypothetical protein L0191_01875 [Acidobacteria bacterium]|nr:hypothetical protein [Acidobacteriota bacterium]